jgi:hypothetical protein
MPAAVNKVKVLGELFEVLVKINDMKNAPNYRRLSPATKEVIAMLETAIRACQEAVRNGHPLLFEINVWEQQALSGWAIDPSGGDYESE